MRRLFTPILLSTTLTLAACSTSTQIASPGPLYVPTTAITHPQNSPSATNAYAVLPESDTLTLFVPRQDKFAWGPYVVQQASAYSVFTYDQQLISNLWGPSYRYRWVTQQGLTVP